MAYSEPPCPIGWRFRGFDPAKDSLELSGERLLWDDPAGGMTVSSLGAAPSSVYRVRFSDQATFDIQTNTRVIIEGKANDRFDWVTRSHVLADQLYPRILAHDGHLVLHAGAFEATGKSILIVGPSGRGKSSLISSFTEADFALLGDDALVITIEDGVPCAKAVYPSLRLFPDSIDAILGGRVKTTGVAHYTAKRRISVHDAADLVLDPKPISAIIMLLDPATDDTIQVDRLSTADCCVSLIQNSFALDPSDHLRSAQRLGLASAIARTVPAFSISYPRDYGRLAEVREAILNGVSTMNNIQG